MYIVVVYVSLYVVVVWLSSYIVVVWLSLHVVHTYIVLYVYIASCVCIVQVSLKIKRLTTGLNNWQFYYSSTNTGSRQIEEYKTLSCSCTLKYNTSEYKNGSKSFVPLVCSGAHWCLYLRTEVSMANLWALLSQYKYLWNVFFVFMMLNHYKSSVMKRSWKHFEIFLKIYVMSRFHR